MYHQRDFRLAIIRVGNIQYIRRPERLSRSGIFAKQRLRCWGRRILRRLRILVLRQYLHLETRGLSRPRLFLQHRDRRHRGTFEEQPEHLRYRRIWLWWGPAARRNEIQLPEQYTMRSEIRPPPISPQCRHYPTHNQRYEGRSTRFTSGT